jgi:hypothetical protein
MIILALIWIHFVADYICQWNYIALNKGKSIAWLSLHVFIYSLFFIFLGWKFTCVNFAIHFVIDFITSRINAKLYKNHQYWFYKMLGFDQALHLTTLILSYRYFVGRL